MLANKERGVRKLAIEFLDKEKVGRIPNAYLSLVIIAIIINHFISRILVDNGSCYNLIYLENLIKIILWSQDLGFCKDQSLLAFNDFSIHHCEQFYLHVTLGEQKERKTLDVCFSMILGESVYNGILGHLFLDKLDAVASPVHLKLKYHGEFGRDVMVKACLLGAWRVLETSNKMSIVSSVVRVKDTEESTQIYQMVV